MSELTKIVDELYVPRRIKFKRRHWIPRHYGDLAQIDLADFSNIKTFNDDIRFCAVLTNIYSRRTYAAPCRGKDIKSVCEAYAKIFSQLDTKFDNFYSDKERSFQSGDFKNFVRKHHNEAVKFFYSESDKKAAIVEASIKILKKNLYRLMALNASRRWLIYLNRALELTNNRVHTRFHQKISSLNKRNAQRRIGWFYKQLADENNGINVKTRKKLKFKLGDIVRFSTADNDIFHKGYFFKNSLRYYQINSLSKKIPPVYSLKDFYTGEILKKKFYEPQLTRANDPSIMLIDKIVTRNKKKKLLRVTYLGYPDLGSEWIKESDLFKTVDEAAKTKNEKVNKRQHKQKNNNNNSNNSSNEKKKREHKEEEEGKNEKIKNLSTVNNVINSNNGNSNRKSESESKEIFLKRFSQRLLKKKNNKNLETNLDYKEKNEKINSINDDEKKEKRKNKKIANPPSTPRRSKRLKLKSKLAKT